MPVGGMIVRHFGTSGGPRTLSITHDSAAWDGLGRAQGSDPVSSASGASTPCEV